MWQFKQKYLWNKEFKWNEKCNTKWFYFHIIFWSFLLSTIIEPWRSFKWHDYICRLMKRCVKRSHHWILITNRDFQWQQQKKAEKITLNYLIHKLIHSSTVIYFVPNFSFAVAVVLSKVLHITLKIALKFHGNTENNLTLSILCFFYRRQNSIDKQWPFAISNFS